MKNAQIGFRKYFPLIIVLEGLLALFFYLRIPSSEKNIVFLGLSKERLIIGSVFLAALLLIFSLWLWLRGASPSGQAFQGWIRRMPAKEDSVIIFRFCAGLVISILLSLCILISPYIEWVGVPEILPILLSRVLPILVWFMVAAGQLLYLLAPYPPKIRVSDSLFFAASIFLTVLLMICLALRVRQPYLTQNMAWEYRRQTLSGSHLALIFAWFAAWVAFLVALLKRKLTGIWLTFLPFFLFVIGMYILPYSGGGIFASRATGFLNEPQNHVVYSVCHESRGISRTIRQYDQYLNADFWLGTKPPGYFTFLSAIQLLAVNIFPRASNCDQAFAWLATALFPWLAGANVFLITAIGKKLGFLDPHKAAILFLTLPNVLFFCFSADQYLFPLLCNLTLLALILPRKPWMAFFGGVLLYISIFVSFSLLPVLGFLGVWYLLNWVGDSKIGRVQSIKQILCIAAGFMLVFVLMRLAFGYHPIIRYQNAFANHRAVKDFSMDLSAMLQIITLNNLEFAIWTGIPAFVLFLAAGLGSLGRWLRKQSEPVDKFMLATFVSFLGLNLLGQTQGEVNRLWIFFCSLIALIVTQALQRYLVQKNILYFLLLVSQLASTFLFYWAGFRYGV